jgi:hypothetical protein
LKSPEIIELQVRQKKLGRRGQPGRLLKDFSGYEDSEILECGDPAPLWIL